MPANTLPGSKNHYPILDGLRGVASILVIGYHVLEVFSDGNRFKQLINHGYLAVDFFFLLSGFVVAYAYDDRWGKMTQWEFYKRRLADSMLFYASRNISIVRSLGAVISL